MHSKLLKKAGAMFLALAMALTPMAAMAATSNNALEGTNSTSTNATDVNNDLGDFDIIDKDDSLKVLKEIAVKSRNIDYYDINEIKAFSPDKVKNIIDDLLRRGVLQRHTDFSNKVKIKVGLFKRWLLNHE